MEIEYFISPEDNSWPKVSTVCVCMHRTYPLYIVSGAVF